jgi:ribosome-associated translation inhibitor RaiA
MILKMGIIARGRQEELVAEIKALDPNASIIWGSIERLEKQLEKLENKQNEQN